MVTGSLPKGREIRISYGRCRWKHQDIFAKFLMAWTDIELGSDALTGPGRWPATRGSRLRPAHDRLRSLTAVEARELTARKRLEGQKALPASSVRASYRWTPQQRAVLVRLHRPACDGRRSQHSF